MKWSAPTTSQWAWASSVQLVVRPIEKYAIGRALRSSWFHRRTRAPRARALVHSTQPDVVPPSAHRLLRESPKLRALRNRLRLQTSVQPALSRTSHVPSKLWPQCLNAIAIPHIPFRTGHKRNWRYDNCHGEMPALSKEWSEVLRAWRCQSRGEKAKRLAAQMGQ